ncbi:MAG: DNA alkylation repair protein [Oscillospiraceae bacterium]|nr:DNA alkylation repair protein [Oscillospiraceae bacterium]
MSTIQERLFALRDEGNAAFVAKLVPTVDRARILGVRTPALRALAKELAGTEEATAFLDTPEHAYLEEEHLHAFLLERIKGFDACIEQVERFLPHVDNWATCDSMSPKAFRRHEPELLEHIQAWLEAPWPYTVRFGIKMLMEHFLGGAFRPEQLQKVSVIESTEYYVNMMRAWYFATALAKQPESCLPLLEEGRLDRWTHNKTIQKAVESSRIPDPTKQYLKTLRK